MVVSSGPTLLSSRAVAGIIPSSSTDHLSWNNDGQCLFVTRRGIQILTPYLTSTLPPPPTLIDPNMNLEYVTSTVNKAKRKALEAQDEDVEMEDPDEPGPSTRARVRRPVGGEMRWWATGIEMDKDGSREAAYGWSDIGDEYSSMPVEKEITAKGAVWSPSGMSDLGGSLLAVLASTGQVSVYAPKSDPASKPWTEISDLTVRTRNMLDISHIEGSLSIRGSIEMRTTCMKWSDRLPSVDTPADTGALLAVANRAGLVALWRNDATRHFGRAAYIQITQRWVNHMSWSAWEAVNKGAYESQLAMASTDCAISILTVRQQLRVITEGAVWETTTSEPRVLDKGDKRNITAVKWVNGLLVWAKHGSIHLFNEKKNDIYKWDGMRSIRLERVGNWASANALGNCIGIQPFGSDGLLVTLTSLTHHLITGLSTAPTLAPLADSLRLSVATRDCFLDFVYDVAYRKDRARTVPKSDLDISAHAGGWGAIDEDGSIHAWAAEPLNWHNLDSATEGNRIIDFALVDTSGILGEGGTILEGLEGVLRNPPRLHHRSPTRVLAPFLFRILASLKPASYAQDLLELCDAGDTALDEQSGTLSSSTESLKSLLEALWTDSVLDALRLRLVVARWASTTFPALGSEFIASSGALTKRIQGIVSSAILRWTAARIAGLEGENLAPRDRDFLRLVRASGGDQTDPNEVSTYLHSQAGDDAENTDSEERCPACHAGISTSGVGSARCEKGHEWSRCSMTNFLVTTASYRVCNTCPAISLFPLKHLHPPLPVMDGEDIDWRRFVDPPDTRRELVDELLEAASACVMCGGRWVRAM